MTVARTEPTQSLSQSTSQLAYLAHFGFISAFLLVLGGWFTYLGLGPWYENLEFPPFQPPPWAFTAIWLIVLSLLAVATSKVAGQYGVRRGVIPALILYALQCVLNAAWSLLFFTLERPDLALWELLVLDATLVGMLMLYWRVSRTAAVMLLPYLAWLVYSTAINAWIVSANGPWGA